jgi:ribonuclease-3
MDSLQAFNDCFKTHTGQTFKNPKLVVQALTHDSLGDIGKPFERLEFLGDGCVEMVIADLLVSDTDFSEGQMSQLRSSLTSKASLAKRSKSWNIGPWIRVGKALDPEQLPDTVYADFFESLLGALYLDCGFSATKSAVQRIFEQDLRQALASDGNFANSKTQLQEWTMKQKLELPQYTITNRSGPAHQPVYNIDVSVGDQVFSSQGSSIKQAEFQAAQCALDHLTQ